MTTIPPDTITILRERYSTDSMKKGFLQAYEMFFEQKKSEPVPYIPLMNGQVIDICQLYHEVTAAGGFEKVRIVIEDVAHKKYPSRVLFRLLIPSSLSFNPIKICLFLI